MQEKLHEECGVFGIYDNDNLDVVTSAYLALYALQHRGQESCGIAVNDDGVIRSYRDLGLVTDVFKPQVLEKLGLNSEEQKEDTNYLDGIQGLLKTKDGQQLNLDNIGTTPLAEKVKTKACDLVLKQGLNFIS